MIPKFIHYCWFGRGEESDLMKKCIASWKKFLPEYEIKVWNEDNFDVNSIPYTRDAYKEKKYAFVSDYVRLCVLYQYGGLYFDVDVELIKPINLIIEKGPFMAVEAIMNEPVMINPGLVIAAVPDMPFFRYFVDLYKNESFYLQNGSNNYMTINKRISNQMELLGWKRENIFQRIADFNIYPSCYFCPMDWYTKKIKLTDNTYSIHWYAESWKSYSVVDKVKKKLKLILPDNLIKVLLKIRSYIKYSLKKILPGRMINTIKNIGRN